MQPMRRFWATCSLTAVLVAGAWVLDEPFLLVGAASIGASLVAHQLAFILRVTRLSDDLVVTQDVSQEETTVETDVELRLRVRLPYSAPFSLSIRTSPPIAASGSTAAERTVTLEEGSDDAETEFSVRWPVAGEYRFSEPTITVRDPLSVFETTLSLGTTPVVTVDPRYPENLHVGIRGERVMSSLGSKKTGNRGNGFDPAEIRQYIPGDTVRHIDWKATARMNSLYVREFEEKTDLSNVLVVDHRSTMGEGKQGRTKLDYARQVALGFVANGQVTNTPCGLYGLDDEGISVQRTSNATKQHFDRLRTDLHAFSSSRSERSNGRRPSRSGGFGGSSHRLSPTNARTATSRLDSSSPFDTCLRPFFETRSSSIALSGEKPLYDAVRTHLSSVRKTVIAVFFTDDTRRAELQEAITVARQRYEQVMVFVTPSILFEPTGLADLSRAYERYVDFEEFRKSLASTNDVTVYEVGPQDPLTAILSTHSKQVVNR
ncbi:DUF58 domain-containing protein [Haladaptatus caseinilyticus]|uniref:DUF58 domain-containing protein n=1 Tax=Haladaptatus caseinilyticus TaxID=2993314 RepID=UPI00224AF60D|nr:DUF58 domain-containing protein [Haladaptatus caseinilyticus]